MLSLARVLRFPLSLMKPAADSSSLLKPISSLSIDNMADKTLESSKVNVPKTKKKSKEKSNSNSVTVPKDQAYLDSVTEKRIQYFDSIKIEQIKERERIGGETIKITLPDGNVKEGHKWISTPFDIAMTIHKNLASNALLSEVNGSLWDMNRPLEGDCTLKLFTFDTDEGRDTFWHSSVQGSCRGKVLLYEMFLKL